MLMWCNTVRCMVNNHQEIDINNLSPASDVRILISVSAKNSSPRYRTSRGRASPHSPSGAWWRNTAGRRAGRPRLSRSMSKCRPANIDTISTSAANRLIGEVVQSATTAFTFKTLLRHYAERALTPRSLNVKLGPRRNYHKGRVLA